MTDWARIVEEHVPTVLRIAQRILGHVHDAEDTAQEVFCEAYKVQQRRRIDSWPALLRRMTVRRSIDRLRRRRTREPVDPADVSDSRAGPLDELVAEELADRLRQELEQLPEQQAAAFSLCYFEGLSNGEIGATLDISTSAVSTALNKARRRLNDRLKQVEQGEAQ